MSRQGGFRVRLGWAVLCGSIAVALLTQCGRFTGGKKYYAPPARISGEDLNYLRNVAKDTWRCIDFLIDPNTQLPYDNIKKHEWTSVSNIGLYVASLAAAVDMGLIPRHEAEKRLEILLNNVNTFVKRSGFTQSWNSVKNGAPAPHDRWISTLDSGNYYGGLYVGRAYFPSLHKLFASQIDIVDWNSLYNPINQKLRFGFNYADQKYGGDLNDIGSDSRLASFLAVASGQIPPSSWQTLNRNMEERYGLQYFKPGWQGGGLFMQYISGLMIDERQTRMGLSAANFAYAQILHAQEEGYPVWGWSACEAPGGEYMGMHALKDEVVTPHACVLAIHYYPQRAIANLKKLEDMGARQPYPVEGKPQAFGFRDSINFQTKAVSENYLLLDQCMLFLALANFLDDGFVWRTFKKNPEIQQGYSLISDFQPQTFSAASAAEAASPNLGSKAMTELFDQRDTAGKPAADTWGQIVEKGHFSQKYVQPGIKEATAPYTAKAIRLDGDLSEWKQDQAIILTAENSAELLNKADEGEMATVYFMWDKTYLYFAAEVSDPELLFTQSGAEIWKDDVIELFMTPNPRSFSWGKPDHFQIGLAASGPEGKPQSWAWFQNGPTGDNVKLAAKTGNELVDEKPGYIIEASIKWSFLNIKPQADLALGVSPAVHFIDAERKAELKLNWCYLPDGKSLGRLVLKK